MIFQPFLLGSLLNDAKRLNGTEIKSALMREERSKNAFQYQTACLALNTERQVIEIYLTIAESRKCILKNPFYTIDFILFRIAGS